MRIKCYIHWHYMFYSTVNSLKQHGLTVESISEDVEKTRETNKMWVVGSVSPENAGNLWKVAGLYLVVDLK